MATSTETKIIEIKVPIGEGIKQIQLLTAEITKLSAGQAALKKGTDAEKIQYEKNAIAIKEYSRQKQVLQREVQTEIKNTQSAMGAYDKLQLEYTKAAAKAKDLAAAHGVTSAQSKKATDAAFKLGQRLKDIDASMNQHQRNVGNYSDAFGALPGSLGAAATGVQGLSTQLKALLLNPVVAVIGAIVGVFLLLKKGLETNREGTEKLNQIFAVFKDVLQGALVILGKVAGAFINGVMAIADFTSKLLSFIPAVKSLNESNQESIRIEKELQRIRRADIVDRAEDAVVERKIAELKKKMRMKDVYDEKTRLGFAREVDRLALNDAMGDKKRAEDEVQAYLDRKRKEGKSSQKQFTNEELSELADLVVKKENTLKEYYEKTSRSASMAATLSEEIDGEAVTKHAAMVKQKADFEKKITENKKIEEQKRLDDMTAYFAEQNSIINEKIREYKKKLEPKEATLLDKVTAGAMEVINANIAKNSAIIAADKVTTDAQIANAEKLKQAKIQKAFDTANAGADILEGAFAFTNALAESELALWAKQNKGKANFDEEYAKKRAELEHKAAVRNKVMQVVNSLINTAAAVVAQLGVPGAGPALAIAAGIAGALQTAAIIATPIPDKDATGGGGGGAKSTSLPPDLTSKMASPLTNSVASIQSSGGSNAITSGAANVGNIPMFDYDAMAKANSKIPAPQLSIVELRSKEKQVDFIDNVSTING